uniref:HNH nuclease domain-containing protein n=1 Tax=Chromera velia CCMP2878 TaxID=1169474 RepID=A0A0G4I5Y9_9ALVE|eukprot:Cvel_1860.t1-p1 / transcript=Cvel_1860.t1 / gene=Cvel_1860 / organism=Chromera_velia_CCMP2878 / gene_product=hypothetical protein / transcript_product=hypothetical protein / location=Cvel_scaffold69:28807-35868(-) / protein_length=206 / sequence_SO=supercontig / SO=protein_coding / is_pseudo=false
MGGKSTSAKTAGEREYANMDASAIIAKSAGGHNFVCTEFNDLFAQNAEDKESVSTDGDVMLAEIVGGNPFAPTGALSAPVSRAVEVLFVSTDVNAAPTQSKHSHEYLGCSFPDLKAHLEKDDFHGNPRMSWENYGSLWHVDHIVPIMFVGPDGKKPDMQSRISRLHFTNLQPMWSEENRRKGNREKGAQASGRLEQEEEEVDAKSD